MNLGDKDSSKSLTALGLAIVTLDGLLVLVDQNFGGMLPKPWGGFVTGLIGLTGGVMTALGMRRAIGNNK